MKGERQPIPQKPDKNTPDTAMLLRIDTSLTADEQITELLTGRRTTRVPGVLRDLKEKTTASDRLMYAIFDDYPPVEEILARTPEDVAKIRDAKRPRSLDSTVPMEDTFSRLTAGQDYIVKSISIYMRSYENVARSTGLSVRMVKFIEDQSLKKMREKPNKPNNETQLFFGTPRK